AARLHHWTTLAVGLNVRVGLLIALWNAYGKSPHMAALVMTLTNFRKTLLSQFFSNDVQLPWYQSSMPKYFQLFGSGPELSHGLSMGCEPAITPGLEVTWSLSVSSDWG